MRGSASDKASVAGVDKCKKDDIIKAISQQRKEFIKAIKGTRTQNGTTIRNVVPYAADRMIERNIPAEKVVAVLTSSGSSSFPGKTRNRICVQKDNIRIVYDDTTIAT